MPSTQQLREQRANVWEQMKEVMAEAEGRDLTSEELAKYDQAEKDLDELGSKIERQERHDQRAKLFDGVDRRGVVPPDRESVGGGDPKQETVQERYERAFWGMVRTGLTDLEREERQLLLGNAMAPDELRALGVGTGSAGGYTVPQGFRDKMVETMKTFGGMLEVSEVINTETGAQLPWPTNDDTANVGAILAENSQVSEQDVTIGTANLDAYMYTSKLVRVSLQLVQDSAFDVEAWLARKLGERIGRIQNQHFTTGTGSSQPDGIVTSATVGKQGTTGQTTSVIYDDLIDLIDSIDPAYQANARFMLGQAARKSVRKLKDSQNRPLWEPSVQAGVPDNLLGYGIVLNQDMPAPAASAKSILFGDYREAYVIRLVTGSNLVRFGERYMDYLQLGFLGFQRADGTLQNAAAVRAYQNSAT
jgi:HK97 family phage major capsid protein